MNAKPFLFSIADLHCDLLGYLAINQSHSPFDGHSRCSIPQMQKGNVYFQTLAIYSKTEKDSVASGMRQIAFFEQLPQLTGGMMSPHSKKEGAIRVVPAVENLSTIIGEDEPFEKGLQRFAEAEKKIGPFLYVSLTWNDENRFGGGNATDIGLKEDGKVFLDFLAERKWTAIDFSHTSDRLAADILNYIGQRKLSLTPIASHSNYRSVHKHPRNLPDEFAREIFQRGGVIGLNFVRGFTGSQPADFIRHVEHALNLGGEDHLCLGADFFPDDDIPPELDYLKPFFFPSLEDSSCYPEVFQLLAARFPQMILQKIAHENALHFIEKIHSS